MWFAKILVIYVFWSFPKICLEALCANLGVLIYTKFILGYPSWNWILNTVHAQIIPLLHENECGLNLWYIEFRNDAIFPETLWMDGLK